MLTGSSDHSGAGDRRLLARKGTTPVTAATFPTHKPLFVGLVDGVARSSAALTFASRPGAGSRSSGYRPEMMICMRDLHGRHAASAPTGTAKRSLFDPMIAQRCRLRKLAEVKPVTRSCWSCWSCRDHHWRSCATCGSPRRTRLQRSDRPRRSSGSPVANFAEAMAGRGRLRRRRARKSGDGQPAHGCEQHPDPGPLRRDGPRRRGNFGWRNDPSAAGHRRALHSVGGMLHVTGESAPVITESGDDRSAVTGGTVVLSDSMRITANEDKHSSTR